jgi:hypothetical protein
VFDERLRALRLAVGERDVQRRVPVAVALVHVHVVVVVVRARLLRVESVESGGGDGSGVDRRQRGGFFFR